MKYLRPKTVLCLSLLFLAPVLVSCGEEDSNSFEGTGQLCSNSCDDADDGFCDDGGEDSDYDVCDFGTDCRDCGPRTGSDNEQPSTSGTLRVENQSTNLSIGAVSAGPCGSQDSPNVVFQGAIYSGSSETISLAPGCYDVTAGDAFFQRSHEQFGIVINADSTTTQGFALD